MQVQELVGIVPWNFIATICNLFIQVYLIKRFLFKPINEMLEKRKAKADAQIQDAVKAKEEAQAMKAEYEKELEESKEILSKLKSKIINKYEYFLPIENSKRSILVIQKLEKTNTLYPREYSKIIKETKNIK